MWTWRTATTQRMSKPRTSPLKKAAKQAGEKPGNLGTRLQANEFIIEFAHLCKIRLQFHREVCNATRENPQLKDDLLALVFFNMDKSCGNKRYLVKTFLNCFHLS